MINILYSRPKLSIGIPNSMSRSDLLQLISGAHPSEDNNNGGEGGNGGGDLYRDVRM